MAKLNPLRVDLHIHSSYYPGASTNLTLSEIAEFARLKGLTVIGTGDALRPTWRTELKQNLKGRGDIYQQNGIYFIPTAEIKLNTYAHSIIALAFLEVCSPDF